MIEQIKAIVLAGGTVNFAYKQGMEDWISYISLAVLNGNPFLQGEPFLRLQKRMLDNKLPLDEALRIFGQAAFSPTNLALAIRGIREHRLTDKDLDDLDVAEMRRLIRQYLAEFYAQDYPFAKEFDTVT